MGCCIPAAEECEEIAINDWHVVLSLANQVNFFRAWQNPPPPGKLKVEKGRKYSYIYISITRNI